MIPLVSSSEELWAEHGLTGLVLLALFGLIGVFIKVLISLVNSFTRVNTAKDEKNQAFIERLLNTQGEQQADHRKERAEQSALNKEVSDNLSSAINDLTDSLRGRD